MGSAGSRWKTTGLSRTAHRRILVRPASLTAPALLLSSFLLPRAASAIDLEPSTTSESASQPAPNADAPAGGAPAPDAHADGPASDERPEGEPTPSESSKPGAAALPAKEPRAAVTPAPAPAPARAPATAPKTPHGHARVAKRARDVAPQPHPAGCPSCCRFATELGPRTGISINGDQWLAGAHLRTTLPCLGNVGLGPMLALGVGGNHLTVRSSGRLDYMLWLDADHAFGIYPAVGASVLFYTPVGGFATFCHRVDLAECSGHIFGGELGGGIRYRSISVDAFVGFGDLPVLTIMAAAWLSLGGAEEP